MSNSRIRKIIQFTFHANYLVTNVVSDMEKLLAVDLIKKSKLKLSHFIDNYLVVIML